MRGSNDGMNSDRQTPERIRQAVMLVVRLLEFSVRVDCGRRPELAPWIIAQPDSVRRVGARLKLHPPIAETSACVWCR